MFSKGGTTSPSRIRTAAVVIRNAAIKSGMVTLRMDGARKVVQGMTTPEEVMMVTAEAS